MAIDIVPGGTSSTEILGTPGSVNGTIDAIDIFTGGVDQDWYVVTLSAGTTYQFDLTSAALDGVLALYNSSGVLLQTTDLYGLGGTESLGFNAATSDVYYIAVSDFGTALGDYTLSATVTGTGGGTTDTVPAGISSTQSLGTPGSVNGTIDTVDIFTGGVDYDWYLVTLTAGTNYQFDLTSATLDGVLEIYNSSGVLLQSVDNFFAGGTETLGFNATTNGSYYIAVSDFGTGLGDYTLSSTITGTGGGTTDTVPAGISSTQSLGTPGSVNGTIDAVDIFTGGVDYDWYQVSLTAGTSYQFVMTSAALDGVLAIYDSSGVLLQSADLYLTGGAETLSFNATTGGSYYIAASDYGAGLGAYTLSCSGGTTDTVPAGISSTQILGAPGSVNGTIDAVGILAAGPDQDWYQVALTAGTSYQFVLTSAVLDGVLAIYDSSGVLLQTADNFIAGGAETLNFNAASSGSYYIAVSDYGTGLGDYTLDSSITGTGGSTTDTVPAGVISTLSLGTPGSVNGTIDMVDILTGGADQDWYQVSLTAGTTYQFDLTSATLDGVLRVYDASGGQLAYADSGYTGGPETLSFNPSADGSYYVSVSSYLGLTTGNFSLSATVTATGGTVDSVGNWYTDPNVGMIADAATGNVSGAIDNGLDSDWYAVQLVAGQNYLFELSSGAPLDTSLYLYDANGAYLNSSFTYQGNESLFFSAASNGTYYLAVYGDNTNTGSFTLLTSVPATGGTGVDTIPNSIATVDTLAVGGSVNGTINSNTDYGDWYGVTLLADTTYQFDLSAALLDGQLGLYDASGMYLSWADSGWGGDPEKLVYTTTQAGTYYVGVSGYAGSVGDFQLGLSQLSAGGGTVDNVGGNSGAASYINVPGHVNGTIDNGADADWYAVNLSANTLYRFDLSSFFIDGILAVYDANGVQQAYADNGLYAGDPESLYFTPTAAGAYYVSVSGYGGTTGSFQLDAIGYAIQSGDFVADSASTTAAVSMPGTVWGTIDSANSSTGGDDADWYGVRLNAGTTYRIDLSGSSNLDGTLNLYGADGTSWLTGVDAGYQGDSEYLYYTASTTGDYYIAVGGWSTTTGEFWLSVAQASGGGSVTDTVGQSTGNSGSVAVSPTAPGHVSGAINDGTDADWYAVTLTANTQYEFNLGSPSLDGILQLYDSQGSQLCYVDNGWYAGDPENMVYTTTTAGTYYIGVSGYGGTTGEFLLDIYSSGAFSNVDAVGDTYQTAASGLLNIGGEAVRGLVNSGADEDVYSVTLTAGTTYLFDLASTSLDGTLTLYGSAGEWLDSADYGGTGGSEYLYFTPTATGSYYIGAGGWYTSTGSYDLSASALAIAADEVPGGTTSTANLWVPGFVDNQIGTSIDTDWFSIRMNQGNEYIFDLYSNDGQLDGILQIFDANGNPVYDQYGNGYADNGWYAGDAEHLSFTASATGEYFIQVSGFGGTMGSYSLYAAEAVAVDTVNWAASADEIKWNVLDWVSLDTTAWNSLDWSVIYADSVSWNQLQYEHVYDANDYTSYAGWNCDFAAATNPGNEQIIGGDAADTANMGIGLDYFSGGLGNDYANGGEGADNLIGGGGSDILNGGIGNDEMAGGLGADTYYVDAVGDIVFEADNTLSSTIAGFRLTLDLGSNIDKVVASISYSLGGYVENLDLQSGSSALTATGNALDNVLTGNALNNVLSGGDGNDTLNGGTGADTMTGGLGNDTYIVDNAGDITTETSALVTEIDNVQSSITRTLGANLENLTLTGTAAINGTGNTLNNTIIGNTGANILTGSSGNDTLSGGAGSDTLDGGTGNDTMTGGSGNDIYIVNATGDITTETSTVVTEIDTVQSGVTRTLGANLENLILTGTAAINGTGNTLNNTITGNAAANIINGGTGNDIMIGGLGNDTYVVNATGDITTETSTVATQIDTVQSSVTRTLGANLEKLILTGTAAINGTGNTLNNTLTGNTGANILDGGSGIDTLIGGAGNDTLRGGTGKDTLTGGTGKDIFDFNAITESVKGTSRDVITDFKKSELDKIDLSTIDANTLAAGNQAFALIASTAAFSAAGQVKFSGGILYGNVNGDTVADFEIALTGVTSLAAADMVM